MKIEVTKQQEELFQLLGKVINGKYIYFPNVYIKLGNKEYEEVSFDKLPEGIKKFIENEKSKK